MNLFCFTLEGSSESIYEPPYSQTLKELQPRYQSSPVLLKNRLEWGGSDPSISFDRPQNTIKAKRNNRRLCVSTKPMNSEISDKHINHACRVASCDKKDLPHQNNQHQEKDQNSEACKTPETSNLLMRDDKMGLNSDRTQTSVQGADTSQLTHSARRLRKLKNLVQTKGGHLGGAGNGKKTCSGHQANMLGKSSPVLTCISLGTKAEKKPFTSAPSPCQQQQAKDVREDSEEEDAWGPRLGSYLWSPFECPQPWTPFYHTCQQPPHDSWVRGRTSPLPRATEWDRFESLIQELDSKQSDQTLAPTTVTDVQFTPISFTRCGRFDAFRQHSPLMTPRDNGSSLQKPEQNDDQSQLSLQRREKETSPCSDSNPIKASPEKRLTAINNRKTQTGKLQRREVGDGCVGRRLSTNSLESLYSLHSGQSSSSGVTSGSDYFSNRDSLRLDDELFFRRHSFQQYCGRARVHTDFVPSPYDTESLTLKVGDVIDIIAKPPMGTWTGELNGKIGSFKFVYVDVLSEECPDTDQEAHRVRHKSTVQEVLKRLSLEEYSSSLQLYGYQTVDDLMRLREHHLTELNVTDPEHRHRLLTAVCSLQQLHSDNQSENEANRETETPSKSTSSSTRDSGCHMPSDSPDSSTEDTDIHLISQYSMQADMTTS